MPSRSATIAPLAREWIAPCHGAQPLNSALAMPVPRVSVRKRERKPISLRADADMLFGHVDHQLLDRLVYGAGDLARDDRRLGDHQLIAFAAHRLDNDRELELAAKAMS